MKEAEKTARKYWMLYKIVYRRTLLTFMKGWLFIFLLVVGDFSQVFRSWKNKRALHVVVIYHFQKKIHSAQTCFGK